MLSNELTVHFGLNATLRIFIGGVLPAEFDRTGVQEFKRLKVVSDARQV